MLERAPHVDVLVGTHNLHRVPELLDEAAADRPGRRRPRPQGRRVRVPDAVDRPRQPGARLRHRDGGLQPRLQLLRRAADAGTRGQPPARTRSSPRSRALVARGFAEVMLLGQTVNAYRHGGTDFAGLLGARATRSRACGACASRRRTPSTWTRAWRTPCATCGASAPTSTCRSSPGSDRVLASMRRGYTRQRVPRHGRAAAGSRARTSRSRATSSSATPARPRRSSRRRCSVLETVGFDGLFVFAYSPRPGTTALRLSDDVPEAEKRRRLHA